MTGLPFFPQRSLAVRRAVSRLCARLGWAPLHEVPLPNGRRADILALRSDGGFACIEVKSGVRDFLADAKWPEYRAVSDALYFAVDDAFPLDLLPADAGRCRPDRRLRWRRRDSARGAGAPARVIAAARIAAPLCDARGAAAGGAGGSGRGCRPAGRAAGGVAAAACGHPGGSAAAVRPARRSWHEHAERRGRCVRGGDVGRVPPGRRCRWRPVVGSGSVRIAASVGFQR